MITMVLAASALLTGCLFSFFYVSVFRAPEPHELPVAVTGINAELLQESAGSHYNMIQASDQTQGLAQLNNREVYGVIGFDAPHKTVNVFYSSVDGEPVLAYIQPVAEKLAQSQGVKLDVNNTTPEVANNASPGRSIFFTVSGTALTGFVLSQALKQVSKQLRLSLGVKLSIMAVVSIIAGLVIAIMLDPGFAIAPGTMWLTWPMVSLLCMASVTTCSAMLELFGLFGQVVSSVLFITLGNATATGMLPMPFLTPPYQILSMILPTGNVVRAVIGEAFFNGANQALGYWVPLAWIIISTAVMMLMQYIRGNKAQTTGQPSSK